MSAFYTPKINKELREQYYNEFDDYDYGIPTLSPDEATKELYEAAIKWCLDNNKPMNEYWKLNYPEKYNEYHKLIEDGCLL